MFIGDATLSLGTCEKNIPFGIGQSRILSNSGFLLELRVKDILCLIARVHIMIFYEIKYFQLFFRILLICLNLVTSWLAKHNQSLIESQSVIFCVTAKRIFKHHASLTFMF